MRGRSARSVAGPVLALLTLAVAGCGAAGARGPSPQNPVRCGAARTAGGVPVDVEVAEGSTACAVALKIERAYTKAIVSGQVPGNGGGAPVTIEGWICQGYNTPKVLRTGDTSACKSNGAEILAVLKSPSSTSSP